MGLFWLVCNLPPGAPSFALYNLYLAFSIADHCRLRHQPVPSQECQEHLNELRSWGFVALKRKKRGLRCFVLDSHGAAKLKLV